MNFLKQNWHKIIVITVMFVALGHWPYFYYQFLRWITIISAGYLAYLSKEQKDNVWFGIFLAIAILFNPIKPFFLSRDTWSILNVAVGIIYIVSIVAKKPKLSPQIF